MNVYGNLFRITLAFLLLILGAGCSLNIQVRSISSEDSGIKMKLSASADGTSLTLDEGSILQITADIQNSENFSSQSVLNWKITSGTGNFVAATGVVQIAPNATSISFPVEAKRNTTVGDEKDFTLEFSGTDFADLGLFQIQLQVRDTTLPANLTAADLNFGAVLKDSGTEGTVTVTNSGEAAGNTIAWSALVAPFSYKDGTFPGTGGTCASTLNGGADCTLVLTYSPTEAASHNESLSATYKTPATDSTHVLQLWGLGVEVTATLGGLPSTYSNISPLDITVGGVDVVAYKYKLGLSTLDCTDSAGYSTEAPVSAKIVDALTAYSNQDLRLCLIGKESHNLWQPVSLATSANWHFDSTALTLSLNQALTQIDPAKSTPVEFTVQFNKEIVPSSFTTADIQQSGSATGVTWNLTTSDNITWSLKATAIGTDGTLVPQINTGLISDISGNSNAASVSVDNSVLYDSVKPTLTLTQKAGQADPTNALPIEFTLTFSEAIDPATFDVSDITQSGTAASVTWSLTTSNNKVWSLKATAANNGTLIPSLAAGAVADSAGNTNTVSTGVDNSVEYNTTAPDNASNLAWVQSSPANTISLTATWVKSPSAQLDVQKIQFYSDAICTTVSGAPITLTNSDSTQVFTGVHGGTYTYIITSIDTAANSVNSSCSDSVTVDTQIPTVTSITSSTADGSYKAGDLISIQITFSEVINVSGSPSLSLNTTPTSRSAIYTSGTGSAVLTFNYSVQATDTTNDLESSSIAALSLGAGTIADNAGNAVNLNLPALGSGTSLGGIKDIVIDTTAPTISDFTITNATPTNNSTYSLTSTVSGSPIEYCILENTTTVASCTWTAGVALPASYVVTTTNNSKTLYAWVRDLAGNVSAMSTSNAITFDNIAPTATITGNPSGTSAKYAMNIDIAGTNVITYKFKLGLTASTDCTSAAGYSTEVNASTNITSNISGTADGAITLCVIGKDSAGNWQAESAASTKTWTKDSPDIQFTATSSSLSEYDSPTHKIYVSIAAATDIAVSASYTYADNGIYPTANGIDYTLVNGTATIPIGSTSVAISIPINDDIRDEYDETFTLTLSAPTGAYLGTNTTHQVTITDDDDPPLVTIQDIYVTEGVSSSFRASLSAPTDKGAVSINWAIDTCTGSDCAVVNTNYTTAASSGTAVIPSGDTYVDFGSINTVDNVIDELYMRVPVILTSVTGGTLYSSQATVFINDNDYTAAKQVVQVETGSQHTCALTSGKRVYCWGKSNYFQTGLNSKSPIITPTLVTVATGSTDIDFIQIGYEQSCAVTSAGALYCWGQGNHSTYGNGNLGNGSGANNSTPALVTGMNSGVTGMSIGYNNSCAIKDGAVYCWGTDQFYVLGKNPGTIKVNNALTPLALPAPLDSGVEKISLHWTHACAIKAGNLYCWGANTQGQLGTGTITQGSSSALQVTGYGVITDVWAGVHGTCFKNSLTDVYCMGNNNDYEISSPATDAVLAIAEMPAFKNASKMMYSYSMCGIVGGLLKCHGRNDYGGLGTNVAGGATQKNTQTMIGAESGVTWAAVNQEGDYVCFVRAGQVYCTGYGGMANLGDGYDPTIPTPILGGSFSGASGASALAPGGYHMCGLFNGGVKCWGDNTYLRAGNLLTDMIYQVPTAVKNLNSGIVALKTGGEGSCAIDSSGALKCWGSAYTRGVGSNSSSGNPSSPTGLTTGVTQVETYAYGSMVCAVKSGEAYCWGDNQFGGVGNGTKTKQLTPYKLTAVGTGVTQVIVGSDHTCALKDDGSVWCSGYNSGGQLGQGDTTDRLTHTQVPGVTAVSIASTGNGVCALLANKTLTCWGTYNGTVTSSKTSPTAVPGLSDVTLLTGGCWNYCVLTGGTMKCWGDNTYGQIGVNSVTPSSYGTPTTSSYFNALGTITDIQIGGAKIFTKTGNNWHGAGLDSYAEFGRASKPFRLAPVSVSPF